MSRFGSIADRAIVGIGITVSGFVLIGVSWLGVSGRAELDDQIPWLLLGVAGLIVTIAGSSLLALRHARRAARAVSGLEQDVSAMHRHAGTDGGDRRARHVLIPPDARTFHRHGCALVRGKDDLTASTPEDAQADGYEPCPLCRPTATS